MVTRLPFGVRPISITKWGFYERPETELGKLFRSMGQLADARSRDTAFDDVDPAAII
jgi:hypothetical protein